MLLCSSIPPNVPGTQTEDLADPLFSSSSHILTVETYINNGETWIIYIFTMFIYLSIYNSAAQIYFPETKCWMREMSPSRSINPTKHRTVSFIPYGKHGHDSMLRWLYRNKSRSHITQIREEEQDNPDWLSQDKRREVLSPFGGAGKGRWAEEIEAKKRTGEKRRAGLDKGQ